MESLFCVQLKFFRMQMSQTVTRQRLLTTCLDSPFNFCTSCSVGRSKGIPTSCSGSWHNGTHIHVMYPTPAELTILLYSIILTNSNVENMSQAKPRRESNPKLVQHFPLNAATQATTSSNSRCNIAQIGVYKPTLCQKKSKVLLVLGTLHKNADGTGF